MSDATRAYPESVSALPAGTRLAEFEIKSLLGIGGFGIVYLAFDHALEREVAIKEYMPASMAGRTETMHVSIRSQSDAEVFELGRRSFVNEAKLLARFDHPSLIKVHRFWEANGTAYMAMPVLRGRTIKDIRKGTQRAPDEEWLRATMVPLLGALERLHQEGVFHRDIAPDNITIEPDGHPVLLDFGAARRVINDKTQTLTAILKPAYAPIEQYAEAGSVKQGPWTDLYALGATLHFMLLGHPPAPATARAVSDESASLVARAVPGCTPGFLAVIDWMLAPRPNERPQSVAELRAVLEGHSPLPARHAAAGAPLSAAPWEKTVMSAPAARDSRTRTDIDLGITRHAGAAQARPASNDATRAMPQGLVQAEHASLAAEEGHHLRPPVARSKVLPLALVGLVLVAVGGYLGSAKFGSGPAVAPAAANAAAANVAAPADTTAPAPATTPAVVTSTAAPAAAPSAAAQGGSTVGAAATTAVSSEPAPATASAAVPAQATAPVVAAPPAPITAPRAARPAPPAPRTAGGGAEPATGRVGATTAGAGAAVVPSNQGANQGANQGGASPSAQGAANAAGPTGTALTQPPVGGTPAAQGSAAAAAAPPAAGSSPPAPGATPEARCGGRNPLSHFVCMERECLRSSFRNHPECEKWRMQARQREGN